jgi:hypothetical protein
MTRGFPVLASSHFAQISTQFDEPHVLLFFGMTLPGQDLIHLVENEQSAAPIQFGFHEHTPVSRQIGQANQDQLLPAGE